MAKTITKVSFKAAGEGGVTIEYKQFDEAGLKATTSKLIKNVPHEDFKAAMQKLKTHVLFILEFQDAGKFKKYAPFAEDDVVAKDFRVCGVTVSGEGDKEGIIITSYRTLSTGLGHSINTPNTRVENEGESAYKFMAELLSDIEDIRKEADEYLHGKVGVNNNGQTVLELQTDEVEE